MGMARADISCMWGCEKMGHSKTSKKKAIEEMLTPHSRKAKLEHVSRDTAKHKETKETLQGQEDLYRAVMENAYFGFTLIDVNYRVVIANSMVSGYFHKPASELIGRECFRAFKKRDSICPNCPGKRAMASGQPAEVDIERVLDDGSYFSASIQVFPTIGPDGAVTGFIEIVEDTTECKKVEKALRESEERYRAIFEQAADSIVLTDAKTRIMIDYNNKVHENLGYSSEEFQKLKISDFEVIESAEEVIEHIEKVVREGADTFETKHRTKSGDIRDVLVNAKVISIGGRNLIQGIWCDITERKKVEERLQQSEEKFKSMFELAPCSIVLLDMEGNIQQCNQQFVKFHATKEPAEAQVGRNISAFFPPEERPNLFAAIEKTIKEKKTAVGPVEYTMLRENGSKFPGEGFSIVMVDETGLPKAVLGLAFDITERKKAEEELYRARQGWENIFQAIGQPSFILDLQHNVLEANRAAVKAIGKPIEQLIGRKCYELLHRKESPPENCPMEKMLVSNRFETVEMEMEVLGGVYLVSCTPVLGRSGHIEKVIHIATDITERKKAERELQKERDKAQKYLDVAAVILVAIDSEQRVGLINRKGCGILGYSEDEILGKNWFDNFLPERIRGDVKEIFDKVLGGRADELEYYENPVLTKNGDERLMAWHNTVLRDDKGEVIAVLSSGEDITERKQAEQKLLDYQRQLKSLASQLMLTEESERHRIATELHSTIGQSLIISKIKLDKLRASEPSGDIARMLDEICESLSQTIEESRSLIFDLSSPILYELGFGAAVAEWLSAQVQKKHGIAAEFKADKQPKPLEDDIRVLLFRSVRELLINVVKHAQAKKVKVSIRKVGSEMRVSVEDDGWGFDPKKAAATAVRKGGFGLFSIRERLEQLGGHLEIESAPGCGTKATLIALLKQEKVDKGEKR